MSKDDFETRRSLLNPYIEIVKGVEPKEGVCVNVSTASECLEELIPPFGDSGPNIFLIEVLKGRAYSIYGVVGRTVRNVPYSAYLNIGEPPISRTLMGFLKDEVLRKNLPRVHEFFNPKGA